MSCPRRCPRHDQYFLPGYTLHQVLELHPTFNGEPNIAGYSEEILMDKIQLVERLSCKLRDLVKCVNDEFYYMYIPNDARLAWVLLKAVCGICIKLCKKYTDYIPSVDDACEITDTSEIVHEVRVMLEHLKFCALHNPHENIKASSLELWCRLFHKCVSKLESYLLHIESTHRNVQAE